MMAGTAANRKFFNVRVISENLPPGSLPGLLPLYALTGWIPHHSCVVTAKQRREKFS